MSACFTLKYVFISTRFLNGIIKLCNSRCHILSRRELPLTKDVVLRSKGNELLG